MIFFSKKKRLRRRQAGGIPVGRNKAEIVKRPGKGSSRPSFFDKVEKRGGNRGLLTFAKRFPTQFCLFAFSVAKTAKNLRETSVKRV